MSAGQNTLMSPSCSGMSQRGGGARKSLCAGAVRALRSQSWAIVGAAQRHLMSATEMSCLSCGGSRSYQFGLEVCQVLHR